MYLVFSDSLKNAEQNLMFSHFAHGTYYIILHESVLWVTFSSLCIKNTDFI